MLSERDKLYYQKNKVERAEYKKLYYQDNKVALSEYIKQYRDENKEDISKNRKQYYQKNKVAFNEYSRLWGQSNKLARAESCKKHRKGHLELYRMYTQKRNALKSQLPNSLTAAQWKKIKSDFGQACCYCGGVKKLTIEHFIPVSKMGELTTENVLAACSSCNSSKGNKDFSSWYPEQPFYSEAREQEILTYLGYKNNIQQLSISL